MENSTFDPHRLVGIVERDSSLFAVTQGEVVGNSIRKIIREWAKKHDAEAFALYKSLKKKSESFAERSKAYEVLVVAYLDSFETDPQLKTSITNLALQHPALQGGSLDKDSPTDDIAHWFQLATYSIPAL